MTSLVEQLLAALVALETSGVATVGPVVNSNTVELFGQKIHVSETITLNLKKL